MINKIAVIDRFRDCQRRRDNLDDPGRSTRASFVELEDAFSFCVMREINFCILSKEIVGRVRSIVAVAVECVSVILRVLSGTRPGA